MSPATRAVWAAYALSSSRVKSHMPQYLYEKVKHQTKKTSTGVSNRKLLMSSGLSAVSSSECGKTNVPVSGAINAKNHFVVRDAPGKKKTKVSMSTNWHTSRWKVR